MKYLSIIAMLFVSFIFAQQPKVADLKIQGNKKLKSSFVKKIAYVKPGVVLDSSLIEEDIRLLKRLPSIAHWSQWVGLTENSRFP